MATKLLDDNDETHSHSSPSEVNSTSSMEDQSFSVFENNMSETELEKLALQTEAAFTEILASTQITTYTFTELSSQECIQLFQDEMDTLKAIYNIKMLGDAERNFEVILDFVDSRIKPEDIMSISFSIPLSYPNTIPLFELINSESQILSYNDTDIIFETLLNKSLEMQGTSMLYDLISTALDFIKQIILEKKHQKLDLSLYDQLEVNFDDNGKIAKNAKKETKDEVAMSKEDIESIAKYIKPNELKLMLSNKQPHFFSLQQLMRVCSQGGYSVVGIENIMRADLRDRFVSMQNQIISLGRRNKRLNYYSGPELVFHGTSSSNLPSIVSKGLLVPGTGNVRVVNGSAYGVGIYVGKMPGVSLSYSNDCMSVLVLALIPGKKVNCQNFSGKLGEVFDGGSFYVIKNPSQLLPCYVVKLRVNSDNDENCLAKLSAQIKTVTNTTIINSDKDINQREKRELLEARMRKFLPFGFGPGDRTIILEAGDWEDDDDLIMGGQEETQDDAILGYGVIDETVSDLQQYRVLSYNTENNSYK